MDKIFYNQPSLFNDLFPLLKLLSLLKKVCQNLVWFFKPESRAKRSGALVVSKSLVC